MNILKKIDYITLKEIVKNSVSDKRYQHSLRTVVSIEKLAARFDLNRSEALIAGIWHDYAREWNETAILETIKSSKLITPLKDELLHPVLLHGAAAAIKLKKLIPDLSQNVFSAIRWHTAGSTEMGKIGYALFVSDFIEEGREHINSEEKLAIERKTSLEEMVQKILSLNFCHLEEQGRPILKSSISLKNYLDIVFSGKND
ncbi:MAG: bis(5'-nucleosyl)-tetraphosphatase (symmetrical) YqeK [Spirochaetia bacterium]|nr:bis(5'-nucleosyl)-tetraphosphatase (symmetrical) YqeK [Spirochaetia bacterium]